MNAVTPMSLSSKSIELPLSQRKSQAVWFVNMVNTAGEKLVSLCWFFWLQIWTLSIGLSYELGAAKVLISNKQQTCRYTMISNQFTEKKMHIVCICIQKYETVEPFLKSCFDFFSLLHRTCMWLFVILFVTVNFPSNE